jgi:SPP1 gp7 family putative phage head morphogenesis protein
MPNHPDPLVVQALREHKAALLAQEESTMRAMAERWVLIERNLEAQMTAAAAEIQQALKAGQVPSAALARQYERYSSLIYQAHSEMTLYIRYADETIRQSQEAMIGQGIAHATEAIRLVYLQAGTIGEYFDILPREALKAMIGLVGDGTPLERYLRRIYADATDGLTQALVDGLAQGLNPVEVARKMRDGFGMGMNHALNTARTETMRAYRAGSMEQYRNSGVVTGWKRLAAHDGRTCAGCLFTEGDFYQTREEFQEHNQGRCTPVPVVANVDEPTWLRGQDWFLQQPENVQASILGNGRFEAWKNGASLDEMATRRDDPVWGASFVPTPVEDLAG